MIFVKSVSQYLQLSEYFMANDIFCPQQYGFRKNSPTELAALELLDRLLGQMYKTQNSNKFLHRFIESIRQPVT